MQTRKPGPSSFTRSAQALAVLTAAAAMTAQAQSDYPGAIWRPVYSGHWNTSGYGHKFHVVHDMEGYYLTTISYFQKSTTSASVHFYVNGKKDSASDAPAGEVSQGVRVAYYAWHVRCWNLHCTGTEHEGFASNPAWYTPEMYQASADLTRWVANHFGFAKDRNHIVAHGQKLVSGWSSWASANLGIDPNCNTHTDPGPYWDWSGYMNRINGGTCVQGAILTRWNQLGGAGGVLGANTTCENTAPDGFGKFTHFQNGSIYWTSGTGAWDVRGAIRDHWSALGWERSPLGYPTTGENALSGGAFNHFQGGSIYWSPSTGAQDVRGAIRDKWASYGWEGGRLGYPTTSDAPTARNDGYYTHFQGGSIFWSGGTGAHIVWGGIRDKWASLGWEQGRLGFPTTDETPTPDGIGAFNHFQGGSIYFSPSTASHVVWGAIRDKWTALGWEQSYLGYPTTDETPTPDGIGAFNHFQNGSIYWSPSTGAHNVQGAIHNKWASLGYEQSSLGYPTSDEYDYGTNQKRSDFQNGWIIYNLTTFKFSIGPGPGAPTALTATAIGGTQVNLTWTDNAANENGFKVERSTDNANFSEIVVLAANAVSYSNTGVTSGTTYYYRVRAYQTNSADTTYDSAYSNVASVTPLLSPDLAAIGEKSGTEGQQLTFTASATNPNQQTSTTTFQTFESFPDSTPNDTILLRRPSNSGSTSAFLDTSTNYTSVKSAFPAGHASARVLRATWGFATGTTNPWVRLNTLNAVTNPNPAIDLDQAVQFDIYSDKSLKIGAGVRETGTTVAYGANGGTTGTIEWIGVTNSVGGSPLPSRVIPANTWTTLTFNVPFEKATAFTGDGVVTSGIKGVLEELTLVPNGGMGVYNVYVDNFAVLTTNTLTYSLDAGAPTGASIHPKTGTFKWTPTTGQAGTYNITVRVTDRLGLSDFETITVSVAAFSGNHKPLLSPIGNKTVNEGVALNFTATATDADAGQTLTYSLDAGAPAGASITSAGAFSWTPTEAQGPGSYPITVRVTDNGSPSQTAFETITVTVNEVNTAPVLAAIPNQTVNEGSTVNVTASATDSDIPANTVTYKLGLNAPAGMTINATTGAITWTTTEADGPSTSSVTVTATDAGGLSSSQTFTVTVNELNVPPVLNINTTLTDVESVTDFESYPDGTYNGTVLFRQPSFSSTTTNYVDLTVTNYSTVVATQPLGIGGQRALYATWSFKTGTTNPWVRFTTFNTASLGNPTIRLDQRLRLSVWTDKSVKLGLGVRETGTGAVVGENGGTTGPLEWVGVSSATGSSPNPNRVITASNWTTLEFNMPAEAITAFPGSGNGVLATGKGVLDHLALVPNGGSGVYNVYIDNIQVVTITTNLSVNTGSTLSVQCNASDSDVPAQSLTFSLGAGAPTNAMISSSGLLTWTPTSAQGPSTNIITVRVTDNGPGNLSTSQNITVIVNKVNSAPRITTVPDQAIEIQSGGVVTFTVDSTDADIPANTLTYSLQGTVPPGATINSATGVFSWTPPSNVSSTNIITIRVTDNGVPPLYDERDFTVYVTATNTAPTLALGTARMTESIVAFETFTNGTPNEQVMFKKPGNSGTTIGFVDTAATNYSTVTTAFPAGHASAKVLKVAWTFKTGTNNYWIRLTTANATLLPNPTINASARLKFDIYADKSLKVAVGIRETGTTAENGGNGGTTGTIEYVGVSGVVSGTPQPTRTIAANTWTTVELDLPNEPKAAFTGDGILNAGQQVLEHLALVGTTTGAHTVYLDNFEVVTTAALPATITMKANSTLTFTGVATDPDPGSGFSFGLDADAPGTASIGMTTGAFSWVPTASGTTNPITVFVNDNPVNGAPQKFDSKTLTVIVNADPIASQSTSGETFVAGGDTVTLTWDSVVGATYKVQSAVKGTTDWKDVTTVTATQSTCSASVTNDGKDSSYRVVDGGSGNNE